MKLHYCESPPGPCLFHVHGQRKRGLRITREKRTVVEAIGRKCDPRRWVDEHGECLYFYALKRVRMPEVAEDLLQETFLAGIRSLGKFERRSSERSWLVGILKNKIYDHLRMARRETSFTDMAFLAGDGSSNLHVADCLNLANNGQERKAETEEVRHRAEFWRTMGDCLSRLPKRHAVVFMLRELDGMSTREICRTVSVSESNLWVMLHRARIALRQALERNWFANEPPRSVRRSLPQ
ncbi:MAG TPA: sigma-70 family RNA polymerase sigma factor [Terrimicrobiaceae bacterium]